jgi:hypothetical protein
MKRHSTPRGGGDVLPVLEEAHWPHRARVVHTPLFDHPESPIVAFAQGTMQTRAYVTPETANGADSRELLDASTRALAAAPFELSMLFRGVAGIIGRELSAERVVDPAFRAALHTQLGPEIWLAVPHRYAVFAVGVGADLDDRSAFATAVRYELARAAAAGYPAVSPLAFRIVNGAILDAVSIDVVDPATAPPAPAPPAPQPMQRRRAATHESIDRTAPAPPPVEVVALPPGIPHPAELVAVDTPNQELNASVLVVGIGAKHLVRAIQDLGPIGGPKGAEQPGELEHAVIAIGRIQGWTPKFYLYAMEPDAAATAAGLATAANAVIVTHRAADGWPTPEVAAAARTGGSAGAVVAVVGPGRAAAALVGIDLDVIAVYDADAPASVFKAVAKHVLRRMFDPAC